MPPEQVFHVHGPELTNRHVAGHDFPERRHRGGFDRDRRAAGHDALEDGLGRARHAEDDFVDAVSANDRLQVVRRSEHLPAADGPALQLLVIVHEPDDFEIGLPQLVQQVKTGLAGASQQQALADGRRVPASVSRRRGRKGRAGRRARRPALQTRGTDGSPGRQTAPASRRGRRGRGPAT